MSGTATYLKTVTIGESEGDLFRVDPAVNQHTTREGTSAGVTDTVLVVTLDDVESAVPALQDGVTGFTGVFPVVTAHGRTRATNVPLAPVAASDGTFEDALNALGYEMTAYSADVAADELDADGYIVVTEV